MGVLKALASGLLGVGDFSSVSLARQAGKSIRHAAGPTLAAGGTAALMKKHEKKEKKESEHEKKAAASNAELRKLLIEHEKAETPAQEKAESAETQALERKAGTEPESHEKKAFWVGFAKHAQVWSIPHATPHGVAATQDKLRKLIKTYRKAKG